MWLEVKIVIGGIGVIFVCIVISQILFLNLILSFLLFVGVGLWIFSEVCISYVLSKGRAKYWYDKPPPKKDLAIILDLTKGIDFEWVKKGPYGKREFVFNGKEASYIDRGNFRIHTPHGVIASIVHEKSEKNMDPYEVEMAEKLHNEFGTDNVKEMYAKAKLKEEVE